MTVPYAFGAATSAIPLSQLDSNFNTPITLGNTAIQLGNTVTTLNNMTLANVTISSGNVTITNVTVTTANATTVNTTTLIATTANVTTGNVTNLISGNVTLTGGSIANTPISGSTGSFTTLTTSGTVTLNGGVANGVAYLDGSKVLTTGSGLVTDGSSLGLGGTPLCRLDASGTIRSTSTGNPASGVGAELSWDGTSGYAIAFNRTAGTWQPMTVGGSYLAYLANGSEQMRLTTTGLGIGTSSPAYKLDVVGSSRIGGDSPYLYIQDTVNPASDVGVYFGAPSAATYAGILTNFASDQLLFRHNGATRMTLNSSGNLGLGVTPSAWTLGKAIEVGYKGAALWGVGSNDVYLTSNMNYDGGFKYATTNVAAYYNLSGNIHKWYTAASGNAGDPITFTQAMTLDASGNLGIGTTSPTDRLHIYQAGTNVRERIVADANFSASLALVSNSQESYVYNYNGDLNLYNNYSSGNIVFYTNGANERARITSGGDFLVGKTAINNTVVGNELRANGETYSTLSGSTNTDTTLNVFSSGASAYRFYVGMGGTVYATSTTITAISDQRLKENIQDIDVGLNAIMALKPRKFDWKEGKGKDKKGDRGWIAQEFEQVFPDMVDTWADPAPEGEEPYKAVNADLIPVLVKALQEMKEIVDAQAARIAALEAK